MIERSFIVWDSEGINQRICCVAQCGLGLMCGVTLLTTEIARDGSPSLSFARLGIRISVYIVSVRTVNLIQPRFGIWLAGIDLVCAGNLGIF